MTMLQIAIYGDLLTGALLLACVAQTKISDWRAERRIDRRVAAMRD